MGYINLNDIIINKDYTAMDIDLMEFKGILAKLETFTNALNNNIEYVKGNSILYVSNTEPENPEDGFLWFDSSL